MDMDVDIEDGFNDPSTLTQNGHAQLDVPLKQAKALTGVTVVLDTNVLLSHLIVIQRFVADIEKMEWPSSIIIPHVVISELDWQKTTRKSISWAARAASRWILDKLKENQDGKVLKVQSSKETLIGLGTNEEQPDRNTENDIKIRDCCRFFQQTTHEPVYLLSGDVNLCIRLQSDHVETLEPKHNWSSRVIADKIFGPYSCATFDDYVQSVRPDRVSGTTDSIVPNYEKMNIDAVDSEWIPSHALDDLHLQLVDHFTILLRELVHRVDPSVENCGRDGAKLSRHATSQLSKRLTQWTAADCVEYLSTLRRIVVTTPKLEAFLSKPHSRDMNSRGRRRGQDWSRRQWEIGMDGLEKLGEMWEDRAVLESMELLRIEVDETFRLQLRPT